MLSSSTAQQQYYRRKCPSVYPSVIAQPPPQYAKTNETTPQKGKAMGNMLLLPAERSGYQTKNEMPTHKSHDKKYQSKGLRGLLAALQTRHCTSRA
eukprot:1034546-Amphidinium_carterae.1